MGMILRIASSRIVGQGDIVGRSGYFSLNLSANSVMRGRLDARRTLKSLVADLRMTIPEACQLVMEAATISTGNQICVFDMGKSVKIADLAKRMIELAGYEPGEEIKIEYTGLRPGEKLYEEVLSNTENTIPTTHDRICIAKVREYDYAEACAATGQLEQFARMVNVPDTVCLMKKIVPEFKSKNSEFERFDKVQPA